MPACAWHALGVDERTARLDEQRDTLTVTLVGVGDATDLIATNNAQLVRGPLSLLIDCGHSVPGPLTQLLPDPNALDAIWLTHCHADHVMGLPALLMWMKRNGRTRPLLIATGAAPHSEDAAQRDDASRRDALGRPGTPALGGVAAEDHWVRSLLELGYAGSFRAQRCFPIEVVELAAGAELEIAATGRWSLQPSRPAPASPSPANASSLRLRCALSSHRVPNWAVRVCAGTRAVAMSGDGTPTEETMALYRGVALLVHECLAVNSVPQGHAQLSDLEAIAERCATERILAVHVASDRRDEMLAALRTHASTDRPAIELGYAGQSVQVAIKR